MALGAFLAARGTITSLGVFLVTWLCNVAGAISVYYAARHYGRGFFTGRTGERLFSGRGLRVVEDEYRRYGAVGLFIAKLLPGIRAMAAPFAGVANVSFPAAVIPMALASGLWYGGVTLLGSYVGANWVQVNAILGAVNRTLGWVGLAVVAAVALAIWIRRRGKARRARRAADTGATEPTSEP